MKGSLVCVRFTGLGACMYMVTIHARVFEVYKKPIRKDLALTGSGIHLVSRFRNDNHVVFIADAVGNQSEIHIINEVHYVPVKQIAWSENACTMLFAPEIDYSKVVVNLHTFG